MCGWAVKGIADKKANIDTMILYSFMIEARIELLEALVNPFYRNKQQIGFDPIISSFFRLFPWPLSNVSLRKRSEYVHLRVKIHLHFYLETIGEFL